jgi:hypothetical protein
MRRIISAALSLGAILALGVVFAGGAQAHTFLWTGATPALLLILADGPQKFQPFPGGTVVSCKHARFHGTITLKEAASQTAAGTYTGCEAFGVKVTVSPAEYQFNANGTVSVINKTITIEAAAKCKIEVKPAGNENLHQITYLVDPNSSETRLLAHVNVLGITSFVTNLGGGEVLCGAAGEHKETGTYTGLVLAWVDAAGALKWD